MANGIQGCHSKIQNFGYTPIDQPLTIDRLFGWHAALFPTGRSGLSEISVGQWRNDRTGPMQVVSGPLGRQHVHFEAPEASRLDCEMRAFMEWFNTGSPMDPVLKSAVAHFWFVTIWLSPHDPTGAKWCLERLQNAKRPS